MSNPDKVKAGAGAEWLLGGFGLLKQAPLALGLVGLVFAIVSVLPALFVAAGAGVFVAAQLVLAVIAPVLLGGVIYAVREVDQGRAAHPGQILQGFREGKALALVAQLVPQILAGVLIIILLVVMVGPAQLQNLVLAVEQAQGQANPDPALFADFPAGALSLWVLFAIVIGVLTYAVTFLVPAQVMFEGIGPFQAMKRSFRACAGNLGAFLVFIVLLILVVIAIGFGTQILALLLGLVIGQMAAALIAQLLLMSVLVPVLLGAAYHAWRQLLGGGVPAGAGTDALPPASGGIEV